MIRHFLSLFRTLFRLVVIAPICPAGIVLAHDIDSLAAGHWLATGNNTLRDVLPAQLPEGNPASITRAWNGGAYDSKRDRMLVMGGGHADYAGNEIYAFDMRLQQWFRLTNPTSLPVAVHTYDQVEYLASIDALFLAGGSRWPDGKPTNAAWLYDFKTKAWRAAADIPGRQNDLYNLAMVTGYDPVSKRIIMVGQSASGDFDPASATWLHHTNHLPRRPLGQTGDVDPVNRALVSIGHGGAYLYKLNKFGRISSRENFVSIGDRDIENADAPGFVYDPRRQRFSAWSEGADIYHLNLKTKRWTRETGVGESPPSTVAKGYNGTYGRFRYMPNYDAFVLVTGIDDPVYVYRSGDAIHDNEQSDSETYRPGPARLSPEDADWLRRSTHSDVITAVNFNDRLDWLKRIFENSDCNPDYAPGCRTNTWDADVRASGSGSVRFDILPHSGQNDFGSVVINFSDQAIGANEEVWIQWRQRFDKYSIEHDYAYRSGSGSWKQVILAQGDIGIVEGHACSENEIVVQNQREYDFPSSYIECGVYAGFYEYQNTGSQYSAQNQRKRCIIYPHGGDRSGCIAYYPDEWMTFMIHLVAGPEGSARTSAGGTSGNPGPKKRGFIDSTFELYVARECQPLELVHRQSGLVLPRGQHWNAAVGENPNHRSDPGYQGWRPENAHPKAEYGKLWLTPYMTNKSPLEGHDAASIWYDEVIVSRSEIASPQCADANSVTLE